MTMDLRLVFNEKVLSGHWLHKLGLMGALIILSMIFGYTFWILPEITAVDVLKAREKQLRNIFEDRQAQVIQLPAMKKLLNSIEKRHEGIIDEIPKTPDLAALLENISKAGMNVGLQFDLLVPQKSVSHDIFSEIPIKMKVTGTYRQIMIFLVKITRLKRVVTIHDFMMERRDSNENELCIDFIIKSYWIHEK